MQNTKLSEHNKSPVQFQVTLKLAVVLIMAVDDSTVVDSVLENEFLLLLLAMESWCSITSHWIWDWNILFVVLMSLIHLCIYLENPFLFWDNSFLKQVLESEYPKLLRLYTDLWRRIQSLGVKVDLPNSLQVEEAVPVDLQHQQFMEQTALDSRYE